MHSSLAKSAHSLSRSSRVSSYLETVKIVLNASVFPLPASASPVNSWVDASTGGLIKKLVDDDVVQDPLVQALLVSRYRVADEFLQQYHFSLSGQGPIVCAIVGLG